jgi:hypothetical protein
MDLIDSDSVLSLVSAFPRRYITELIKTKTKIKVGNTRAALRMKKFLNDMLPLFDFALKLEKYSFAICFVIKKPETTKNMSTPIKPFLKIEIG